MASSSLLAGLGAQRWIGNAVRRLWKTASRRIATVPVPPQPYTEVRPEVADAIASGHPVVALETTIITHGMPYPENLKTAVEVEGIVRSMGAVPATIGILDGRVHVGLTHSQLEKLANPQAEKWKVSRRDLAYVLGQGRSGGTTVSATMLCAHKVGIPIFVTGGIGGVHREGENTLDVSTDLTELGRTPVAVVCAGVKSILDIGRTLEVLETQGVTVATYGPSKEFPAFFSPKSGLEAPFNVKTSREAAEMIESSLAFGAGNGVLIAVPVPAVASAGGSEIEQAIQQALTDAKNAGVTGKAVTPFVLQRVNELTGGKSLQVNVELVRNNARVGSHIAVELSQLRSSAGGVGRGRAPRARGRSEDRRRARDGGRETEGRPVVVGGAVLDFVAKVSSPEIKDEGTNPGTLRQSFGGVGRNIAECLARLGTRPFFISAVGDDDSGQLVEDQLQTLGMSLAGVYCSPTLPTATYCAVLDRAGEMHCSVGDMAVHSCVTVEWVKRFHSELESSSLVCVDANTPEVTLKYVCDFCWEAEVPVWYEPTCLEKATKPMSARCISTLTYASPNLSELRAMNFALTGEETASGITTDLSLLEKLRECRALGPALLEHVPNLLISLGRDGVVHARQGEVSETRTREARFLHYPAAATHLLPVKVVNVTGGGDSFAGGMIASLTRGLAADIAVKAGLRAAYLSIQSHSAVASEATPELFTEQSIAEWAPWTAEEF